MHMLMKDNDLSVLEPTALAFAVIYERIGRLSKEDQDDIYELFAVLFKAEDAEAKEAAARAMLEILNQTPSGVRSLEPSPPDEELQNWMNFVGGRIKQYRGEAKLTQEELAEKAGLPQSHISRLENCKHSPSAVTLKKIADALGIPTSSLDPSA